MTRLIRDLTDQGSDRKNVRRFADKEVNIEFVLELSSFSCVFGVEDAFIDVFPAAVTDEPYTSVGRKEGGFDKFQFTF